MSKTRKPLRHGGPCFGVACHRMAETDPHPGASKCSDEARRHAFGCERHDSDRAAPRREEGEVVVAWRSDVAHCVHAWPLSREERSFEMNAENGRLFVDERL